MPSTWFGRLVLLFLSTIVVGSSFFAHSVFAQSDPSPPDAQPSLRFKGLDIGNVGETGSTYFNVETGEYTVAGSGADIYGKSDQFHYAHVPWSGDGEITARVTEIADTHQHAKAGVMFRETLDVDSANAIMEIKAAKGAEFQYRQRAGEKTLFQDSAGIKAPHFIRLERRGDTFTGYRSTDGAQWELQSSVKIPMAKDIFVGLSVTAHNNKALNTATFDNIKISSERLPVQPIVSKKAPDQDNAATAQKDGPSLYVDYLRDRKDLQLKLNAEYIRKSTDSEEIKDAFLKLRNRYLERHCGNPERIDTGVIYSQARAFLKLQPTEPLSIVQAYSILQFDPRSKLRAADFERIEQASSNLKGYSHQARLLGKMAEYQLLLSGPSYSRRKTVEVVDRYLAQLFRFIDQTDSPDAVQRFLFQEATWVLRSRRLWYREGPKIPGKMIEHVNASTSIKPWLKNMLLGSCHESIAWDKRGGGFANRVSEKGWQGFEEHLSIAVENFKRAYEINPQRPESASKMIGMARAYDTELDERAWFERVIDAEFDYPPAYDSMLYSLYPRWGGSHQQMLEFGRECLASERFDTKVPYIFIKAVNGIRSDYEFDYKRLKKLEDLYPEIHKVCDSYEKHFVEHGHWHFGTQNLLRCTDFAYAYVFEHFDDARAVYKEFDGDIRSKNAMVGFEQLKFDSLVAVSFSMLADADQWIQSIEERMGTALTCHLRTQEETEKLYEDVNLALMNDIPEAEPYLRKKQELLEKQIEFHNGDWVELNFTPDLRHWQKVAGLFTVEGPKSVVAKSNRQGSQCLSYLTSFPPPYEVELTVEFIASEDKDNFTSGGFICGLQNGPRSGRIFFIDEMRGRIGIGAPGKGALVTSIENGNSKLRVNVFDGFYELYLGDDDKMQKYGIDDRFVPGRVGIGVYQTTAAELRYKDFRIRKLNFDKPPSSDDLDAMAEYYANRLQTQEEYRFRMYQGTSLMRAKRLKEALQVFSDCQDKYPQEPDVSWRYSQVLYALKSYPASLEALHSSLEKCVGEYKDYRVNLLNNAAWQLATCPDESSRDGKEAVVYAKELLRRKKKELTAGMLDTIAVAFAANGEFEKAIQYCEQSIEEAKSDKNRKTFETRLELFKQEKPYHEQ